MAAKHYQLLSLPQITSANIDKRVADKQEEIRLKLPDIFTHLPYAEEVGKDLLYLVALENARTLMNTIDYRNYEKAGKPVDYETWLQQNAE